MYVFSDGSLSANGQVDNTADGRGKFMWTQRQPVDGGLVLPGLQPERAGDACSVRVPGAQPGTSRSATSGRTHRSRRRRAPAANNVNLLVETVVLNYMALHGEQGQFGTRFPGHGLGSAALQDSLIAFNQIVSGTIA